MKATTTRIDRAHRPLRNWLCSTSLVVLAASMPVGVTQAQEWTGTVSTDWGAAGNWQGGSLPTASTDVTINNEGAGWPVITGGTRASHNLIIGDTAAGGSLRITGAGVLNTAANARVGLNHSGSATVTGSGSSWNVTNDMEVGTFSTGTLTISNFGRVDNRDGYVGTDALGNGTVNVSSNGRWVNSRDLLVGYRGTGILNITTGGQASATTTNLGYWDSGSGTITINGTTSALNTDGLIVGRAGNGLVAVSNNGEITSTSGIIGSLTGSTGSVILQSGALWTAGTALTVGAEGQGTLNVSGGSTITSQSAIVGRNAGGVGTASLTGSGSGWANSGDFVIGRDSGSSGTMTVTSQATANSGKLVIGANAGAIGNLTVSDRAVWTSTAGVLVGEHGTGTLNIADIGHVISTSGSVGTAAGGDGTVVIGNTSANIGNSHWGVSNGALTIGGTDGKGRVTVGSGGLLESQDLVLNASGANGLATLTVQGGGTVGIGNDAIIGANSGSRGTATITGFQSLLDVDQLLVVGGAGNGSLTIADGGNVITNRLRIGFDSSAIGDVTVTGQNSRLEVHTNMTVGDVGTGTLTIENGGLAVSAGGRIAQSPGSNGTVLITGANSRWTTQGGGLFVGDNGTASLTVTNDGELRADAINIGTIGSSATMTVSGGASIESADVNIGFAAGRNGSVLVTGAGTSWVADAIAVGDLANGSLIIEGGATFTAAIDASIGKNAGSSGNVLVTGAGSALSTNSTLDVGAGDNATLRVENGGTVNGWVRVLGHGTLSGNGTIIGDTDIHNGGTLVGEQGQTLTLGNLSLSPGSNVNVALGTPGNATGLFTVNGSLTIDGTLNVANAGGFGAGVYRIFDYTGSLGDGGLDVGAMPSGTTGTVQTAVANQVNLLVSGMANDTQFWNGTTTTADGAIHGGSGIWRAGPTNWTDANGTTAGAWGNQFAVFQNNPDAVTVDDSAGAITATGMQFVGNGWNVSGDAIALNGASGSTTVRVGDGTAAGAGHLAVINSALSGNSRLVKDDLGILIITGDSTYTGGTWIKSGGLVIGHNGTTGSIIGDVLNDASMTFSRTDATTFAGTITGTGSVHVARGQLTFTADNSYADETKIATGASLSLGNGGTTGSVSGNVVNKGSLVFNRSNDLTFGGIISSTGAIRQIGAGTTILTGNSGGFTGATEIAAGALHVNGTLGGSVSVQSGGTLAGSGTVGAVSVAGGGTLVGVQGQTLTTGNLTLASGSDVDVSLGAPGNSVGLFKVNGDLVLDGTLNVSDAGGFGMGVYRIIDYTGSLTNNGMDVGMMPSGTTGTVQTAMANQVNLLVAGVGNDTQFWNGSTTTADGVIHGGDGVWISGPTNWTDANGATAGAWGGKFAVFQNNPGTVTVDTSAGAILTTGMQFIGQSWTVQGDAIALDGAGGATTIRVGDGSAAGASHSAVIASELTGNSRLVKDDLGTLVLSGANTYTGGTQINAGTLQIANNGAIVGDVLNNGRLTFARNDAFGFGGVITGNGEIRQIGAGTTTLTGNSSSFSGSTTVTNGTLAVNGRLGGAVNVQSGGTLTGSGMLTGAVSVANGGTLAGVQGQTLMTGDLTLASGANVDVRLGAPGNMSLFRVAGDLVLDGTLNVTDAGGFGEGVYRIFDYTGLLTDNGLDVGLMPPGTAGSVQTAIGNQVNLLVGGAIGDTMFWNGTHTIANGTVNGGSGTWMAGPTNWTNANGSVAGAWNSKFAVFQTNPGVVTVNDSAGAISTTGMQFIGEGWRVTGDTITLNGDNGATTIRVGDGTAGGASHSATIASELTGASRLVKNDLGTLILTGTNSYTGGTTIAAGTLQIGDGGTSGAITGDVLNNGLLRFSRTDSTTFDGLISGSGAVHVSQGQLTLTADNSYTGDTTISSAGMLILGDGGTTGSIAGNVDVSGTLAFGRSNDLTYAGVISGSGAIRQIGTGKTELTGNSSGFTGTTFVDAGILAVNGQLGGTLDVLAAGRLQGVGTVGNTIVRGTIAPGNSIGTLNVAGNITFAAGSIYEVEANPAGQSDKILASGSATINGGTVQVLAGAGLYNPQTDYTILTAAGGVSGTFANVTSNLAFLDPSLKYDAGNVYLRLQRNDISFSGIGGTPNQVAAGEGTETLGWNNPVFDAVVNLSVPQAQDAFDQLSGEIHPSARTAMIEDSRLVRHAVWERLRSSAGDEGRGVWGHAIGSWGHTSGDGNAARLDRNSAGLLMGLDASAGENVRLGAVWGYHQTDIDVDARASSAEIDNFHVGIYAGGQWDRLGVRAGAAYALQDIHTVRNIAFPGFSDTVRAGYNGETVQAFGELGYSFDLGRTQLEPYTSVAYVRSRSNEFSETGGAAKLSGNRATTDVTFTTLGLRSTTSFNIGEADAKLKLGAGWRHAFGDNVPVTRMRYQAGGDAFSTMGVPVTRDSATIDAGLDVAVSGYTSIGLSYQGQIGDGLGDHTAKASIRFRF